MARASLVVDVGVFVVSCSSRCSRHLRAPEQMFDVQFGTAGAEIHGRRHSIGHIFAADLRAHLECAAVDFRIDRFHDLADHERADVSPVERFADADRDLVLLEMPIDDARNVAEALCERFGERAGIFLAAMFLSPGAA